MLDIDLESCLLKTILNVKCEFGSNILVKYINFMHLPGKKIIKDQTVIFTGMPKG